MHIIGRKSDKARIYNSGLHNGVEPTAEQVINTVVSQYGGTAEEYAPLHLANNSPEAQNIFDGYEYDLLWENDTLIGVDFSKELAKPKLHFTQDKPYILANGTDTMSVVITAKKEDGTIDTSLQGDILIPIKSQLGTASNKIFSFTDGIGTSEFKTNYSGKIGIPLYNKRFDTFRVANSIELDIVMV